LMVWDFEFERDFPFIFVVKLLNKPFFQHSKDIYGKLQTEECNFRYCIFRKKAPKSIPIPGVSKVIRSQFIGQ
jgi:hypothetical protein